MRQGYAVTTLGSLQMMQAGLGDFTDDLLFAADILNPNQAILDAGEMLFGATEGTDAGTKAGTVAAQQVVAAKKATTPTPTTARVSGGGGGIVTSLPAIVDQGPAPVVGFFAGETLGVSNKVWTGVGAFVALAIGLAVRKKNKRSTRKGRR